MLHIRCLAFNQFQLEEIFAIKIASRVSLVCAFYLTEEPVSIPVSMTVLLVYDLVITFQTPFQLSVAGS